MNIYLIDEGIDRIGGVERIVSILANDFANENKVKVISEFKNRKNPFYEYNSKIEIEYLIKNVDTKLNKISKKNIIFYFIKLIEKCTKKFVLPFKILKTIKNIKNDDVMIFARVSVALDFISILNYKKIHPIIIVRDAAIIECLNKKQKIKLKKFFPKYVNYFIVSSEESKKKYQKVLGNKIIIEKIYNPLGINPIKKYNYNAKKIISIGRLHPQKGFDTLIRAFNYVAKKHSDWILEIYGNGREEFKLKKIIKENRLENKVKIINSTKDVVKVLNNSSIFVMASRYEGYANALVEAVSCGVPSVTFNWLSGAEEIISHQKNGLIVKLYDRNKYFRGDSNKRDEKNLADSINYLIENPQKCNHFSNESINVYKSRELNNILEKWKKIINEVKENLTNE